MAKRFLTGVNLANLASDPETGTEGDLYFNTTKKAIRIYRNDVWTDLSESIEGDLTNITSISSPEFIEFDTTFSPSASLTKGSLYWNEEDQTLDLSLENEITLQIGQEEHYPPVINNSGVQINRGELVMVTGIQGDKLSIAKAVADGTTDFNYIIGVAAHNILDGNDDATIIKFGYVGPVNTSSYEVGTVLYPNPAVPGGLTNILPDPPGYKVPIAIVTKQGNGGKILVRMQPPSRLGSTDSNVYFDNLQDKDILTYNGEAELWFNGPISNVFDINQEANRLFVHDQHENISAQFNSDSNIIILSASPGGGDGLTNEISFGFDYPEMVGVDNEIYYQINSASTQLLAIFEYINGSWINLLADENNWYYLLGENWQEVINNSGSSGWNWVLEGQGVYDEGAVTYNERYVPHLVADLKYLTALSACATYLAKTGGTVTGDLKVDGELFVENGLSVDNSPSENPKIKWNQETQLWEFSNDGVQFKELGSGGGALLYQSDQPDTSELEPGTVWIDSDQDAVSGLQAQTFSRWIKTLQTSASVFSGVDDNITPLKYFPTYEQVFFNGALLVRDEDYIANDGLTVTLLESGVENDIIEIHSFEPFLIADSYTREQIETLYATKTELLQEWAEDEEGNLLPSEDSTFSIGSEDYKVKDLYLSASSLYLEDPSNPGQTIALSVDSEGSLKVGEAKLITESNANDTLDTSFLLTNANASATYLSQSSASSTYLTQTNAINLYIPKTDNNKVYNKISSFQHYNTGYGTSARTASTSTSWYSLNIGGTGLTGTRASGNNNILTFNKQFSGSHLLIDVAFPFYIAPGNAGVGLRCQISTDGSNYNLVDVLTEGPAHGWGVAGYGGATAAIINFQWYTKDNSSISSNILNKTGEVRLFFQGRNWNSADTAYWIDYADIYPKFGSINIYEVME